MECSWRPPKRELCCFNPQGRGTFASGHLFHIEAAVLLRKKKLMADMQLIQYLRLSTTLLDHEAAA